MTDTRVCKGCKVEKPISEFRVVRNNPLHKCRDCGLEYNRKYMRAYRKQRTADRRIARLAESVANPIGRPSYQQRLEDMEAQMQSLLAFAKIHGYNTTET